MNMNRKFLSGLMMAVMLVGMFIGITTNAQAGTTPQFITFDLSSQSPKTYGDTSFALTATASSLLPVSYASSNPAVATVSGNMINIFGAGTTTITASQGGDTTYAAANPVEQQLIVNKRPITVRPDPTSKIYGGSVSLPYTITSGSLVPGDNFIGALGRVLGENVGTYAIQPGSLAINANYVLTFELGALFTINPKPITVTADAKSKGYGDSDPPLTYQLSEPLVSGDNYTDNYFTGSLVRVFGEALGPYAINQGTLALSTNYVLTYQGAILTIGKGTPIITSVPTASRILDGQALSASILTGGVASVSGSFAFNTPGTIPPAGSYSAAITFTPTDTPHYNTLSGTVTVAVGKPNSVRIKRGATVLGPYSFIEDAFAVPPNDNDIIEMWGIDFYLGEKILYSNIDITLKGGFETSYGDDNPGPSSILHGTFTVKQGTLRVEKLVLRLTQ